jgi:hypothetical protein
MAEPRFPDGPPLNGCGCCHRAFASLRRFDAHRVGVHAYDWSPEREDGRRCLDVEEEPDWLQDQRLRWTTRKLAAQGRAFGQRMAHALQQAPEAASEPRGKAA